MEDAYYFNIKNNYKLFNVFPRKIIRNNELSEDSIHFQIEQVQSRSKNNNETFDAILELENQIIAQANLDMMGKKVGGKKNSKK